MEAPKRGPGRPPTRSKAETRPELDGGDDRLARRISEIRDNQISQPAELVDEFYVPLEAIPDGWSYEWKRLTTMGKEDPYYITAVQQTGWEAVPASRHPELMPVGYQGDTIVKKGLILMERPKVITDEMRKRDARTAREAVAAKEAAMAAAPKNEFDRQVLRHNRSFGKAVLDVPEE
jgi:hypothetical protein